MTSSEIRKRIKRLENAQPEKPTITLYQGWDNPDLYFTEYFDRRQKNGVTRTEARRQFEGCKIQFVDIDPDHRKAVKDRINKANKIMEGKA